jgi:hypothetical protein
VLLWLPHSQYNHHILIEFQSIEPISLPIHLQLLHALVWIIELIPSSQKAGINFTTFNDAVKIYEAVLYTEIVNWLNARLSLSKSDAASSSYVSSPPSLKRNAIHPINFIIMTYEPNSLVWVQQDVHAATQNVSSTSDTQ